jgi:hypothetical protein
MKFILRATAAVLAAATILPAAPSIAATASVAKSSAVIPAPAAGKAQIVFWRPDKWFGKAIRCTVREGGKMVGRPGPGRYFILPVEPGLHKYATKVESSDTLSLEMEPDQTFYVKCSMVPGGITYNANIAPSSKEEFDAVSVKLKMMDMADMAQDIANDDKKRAAPAAQGK